MAARQPDAVIMGLIVVAVVATGAGLYSWKQGENDKDANAKLLSLPIGADMRLHGTPSALADLARDYPGDAGG